MISTIVFIVIHLCIAGVLLKNTNALDKLPLYCEIPAMGTILFAWVKLFGLSIITFDILLSVGI